MKYKNAWSQNGILLLIKQWRLVLAVITLSALAACGGGGGEGGGEQLVNAQIIQGAIARGVIVIPEIDAAAATLSLDLNDKNSLNVSNPTGALASAQNGQIVVLPANDAQGIPFGLTAKVLKNSDGSVSLQPANLNDVFSKLHIDFDTARDGGQIAGLISPKGANISLNQTTPSTIQAGVEFAACQLGLQAVVDIKCKNGALEGLISIEQKIQVKKVGSSDLTAATIYGTIDISKLAMKVKLDFDPAKYPETGGLNQATVKLTGEWGATIGIRSDDSTAKFDIPSWSEHIRADEANIWDKNTRLKFGKYFEISGLNGDDKKGLIPLGGFYLTPAGGTAFSGDLSAHQLGAIKTLAAVVWVYLDLEGNIKLSGDFNLLKFNGVYVEKGFDVTNVNNALASDIIDVQINKNLYVGYLKGSVESKQNLGLAVAADVLVGGIRPLAVKAEIIGADLTAKADGEGGLRVLPQPSSWEGNFCFDNVARVYSDIVLTIHVQAKLDSKWLSASAGIESKFGPATKEWANAARSECINTLALVTVVPQPTYAAGSGEAIAYATFNDARQQCGFGLLAQNASLDRAATAHGNYLTLNASLPNLSAHFESAGSPGFTGATPADRAVAVGYSTRQVGENINFGGFGEASDFLALGLLAAPYHAISTLSGYRDIGLAWSPSTNGHNLIVKLGLPIATTLQVADSVRTFPCEGTNGVRPAMSGEVPNPFPNDLSTVWGQPIIVKGATDLVIRSASLIGPNGSIPLKAIYGAGQAIDPNGQCKDGWACVIPARLEVFTTYQVKVAGTNNGVPFNLAFAFKTGATGVGH